MNYKKCILKLVIVLFCNNAFAQEPLNYSTSWIANTGGKPEEHIMHGVQNMYVRPDGRAIAITNWDEGGFNVSVFKDGKLESAPVESGTGSWGKNSNKAVYSKDNFIYQSMSQHGCDGGHTTPNSNGFPQYPPCNGDRMPSWQCVRRYHLDGSSAPFAQGYGYDGSMMIVNIDGDAVSGITSINNELFISDPTGSDTIKVYDLNTLNNIPIRKYHIPNVGLLATDAESQIWMLTVASGSENAKLIRFNPLNGQLYPQQITFPGTVKPSSFCIDQKGQIWVTDIGISQNVRIYSNIYTSPTFSRFFGIEKGIYANPEGLVGDRKLLNPMGIGIDSQENIYIANNLTSLGGVTIESYSKQENLNWKLEGLAFTATADLDKTNEQDVYLVDKKIKLDLSITQEGKEWKFHSITLNPFKYPHDPRLFGFYTSPLIRTIKDKKYLYSSDMYGFNMVVNRFDMNSNSEIAIPNSFFTGIEWGLGDSWGTTFPIDKEWIWQDQNGDGFIQQDEYETAETDNPYLTAWWVDEVGGVWKGARENGIRYYPPNTESTDGIIKYSIKNSIKYDNPNGVKDVKRIYYSDANDELFVAGFSPSRPDKGDTWWAAGSVLIKYSEWKKGNRDPSLIIKLPFRARNNTTSSVLNVKAFTVEGDYIFAALEKEGIIMVYDRSNGSLVGTIKPGESIGSKSGWTDINIALTAHKLKNNEYLIFAEENGYGKVIMYRWCPKNDCTLVSMIEDNEQVTHNKLVLYPNPSNGKLYLSNAPIGSVITICDMNGRVLITEKIISKTQSINVSSLSQGVYLVKVGEVVKKISIE